MSTIEGQANFVIKYNRKFEGNFVDKIARQPDFSITNAPAEVIAEAKARLGRLPYKIEDIPDEAVIKYLQNTMYSATNRDENSIKEEKNEFRVGSVVVNDEGETALPADLLDTQNKPNFVELKRRRAKLALAVKKLHNRGKRYRTHMMSLVISYERAKKLKSDVYDCKFRYVKDSTYQIMENGSILKDTEGNPITIRNDGVNKKAIDFINGENRNDSAYKAYKDLLWICSEEGIDLSKENPLDYDEKFMDALVVTTVTKNREYLNRKYVPDVAKRLRDISVSEYAEDIKIGRSKRLTREDYLENKITEFRDMTAINFLDKSVPVVRNAIQRFLSLYARVTGNKLVMVNKYKSYNEILINESGRYIEINVSSLLRSDCAFVNSKAVIHMKGFLILIDNYPYEDYVRYLPIETAVEFLQELEKALTAKGYVGNNKALGIDIVKNSISHTSISGNRTFGVWDVL